MLTVERIAFQSILHLKLCAKAGCRHMRSRKLHPCSVSALYVSYPLAQKRLSMYASVVAVAAILLLWFVSLVLFSTVKQRPGTVLPPCGIPDYRQNNFSAHVRPERINFTRTVRCPTVTHKK